jgi:hypothetical protein
VTGNTDGPSGPTDMMLVTAEAVPLSRTTRWVWWLLETLALVAIEIALRRMLGPCWPRRRC